MLPCVAMSCRVLLCVAVCCRVLPCVAVCCRVLPCYVLLCFTSDEPARRFCDKHKSPGYMGLFHRSLIWVSFTGPLSGKVVSFGIKYRDTMKKNYARHGDEKVLEFPMQWLH